VHQMTQWQPAPGYDAFNPLQISRQPNNTYGPSTTGGVTPFFFNKVPTTVKALEGLAGSFSFSSLGAGTQMLIVGGLAAIVGFAGMKFVGPHLGIRGHMRAVRGYAPRRS